MLLAPRFGRFSEKQLKILSFDPNSEASPGPLLFLGLTALSAALDKACSLISSELSAVRGGRRTRCELYGAGGAVPR